MDRLARIINRARNEPQEVNPVHAKLAADRAERLKAEASRAAAVELAETEAAWMGGYGNW